MATRNRPNARTTAPTGAPTDKVPERPTAVFILGMHRSGTSALTRVMNLLGVERGRRTR